MRVALAMVRARPCPGPPDLARRWGHSRLRFPSNSESGPAGHSGARAGTHGQVNPLGTEQREEMGKITF